MEGPQMKLLAPTDASAYLRERYGITHTPKTLANRRHLGLAPTFVRVARRWPRYTKKSLDAYAEVPAKKE